MQLVKQEIIGVYDLDVVGHRVLRFVSVPALLPV